MLPISRCASRGVRAILGSAATHFGSRTMFDDSCRAGERIDIQFGTSSAQRPQTAQPLAALVAVRQHAAAQHLLGAARSLSTLGGGTFRRQHGESSRSEIEPGPTDCLASIMAPFVPLRTPSPERCWSWQPAARCPAFTITGTELPTPDGTGIWDCIHVWDLAQAHVVAVEQFDTVVDQAGQPSIMINVGRGEGISMRELITEFVAVYGKPVPTRESSPRPGDVIGAYANVNRAKQVLQWQSRLAVADGIASALRWADRHRSRQFLVAPDFGRCLNGLDLSR